MLAIFDHRSWIVVDQAAGCRHQLIHPPIMEHDVDRGGLLQYLLCCSIENYCVASAQALDESILKCRRACEERRKTIRSFINRSSARSGRNTCQARRRERR